MRLHQSEYYLACVGGRPLETDKGEIPVKPEALAWSERYWQQHFLKGKPVMTLAPGVVRGRKTGRMLLSARSLIGGAGELVVR